MPNPTWIENYPQTKFEVETNYRPAIKFPKYKDYDSFRTFFQDFQRCARLEECNWERGIVLMVEAVLGTEAEVWIRRAVDKIYVDHWTKWVDVADQMFEEYEQAREQEQSKRETAVLDKIVKYSLDRRRCRSSQSEERTRQSDSGSAGRKRAVSSDRERDREPREEARSVCQTETEQRDESRTTEKVTKPCYHTIQMVHDSNSFFRCISYAVFGRQSEFQEMRKLIRKFVFRNWDRFCKIAVDAKGQKFPSRTAYKKFACSKVTFGDFCDAVAVSEMLNCPVEIFQHGGHTLIGEEKPGNVIGLKLAVENDLSTWDFLEDANKMVQRDGMWVVQAVPSTDTASVKCSTASAFGFSRVPAKQGESRGEGEPGSVSRAQHSGQNADEPSQGGDSSGARRARHSNGSKAAGNSSSRRDRVRLKNLSKFNQPHKQAENNHRPKEYFPKFLDTQQLSKISSPRFLLEKDDDWVELVSVVPAQFGTQEVSVLVDTGAAVNCIQYDTLKNIFPTAVISKCSKSLAAANKTPLKTYGVWRGEFKIADIKFAAKFFVIRGLSAEIILGNPFLLKYRAKIDYDLMQITFRDRVKKNSVKFGVFYKAEPASTFNCDVFKDLDVTNLYYGPLFVHSVMPSITIPPREIKWVRVKTQAGRLDKDTVFIGNPSLFRNYKILVSDFMLSPDNKHYVQVTNTNNHPVFLTTNLILAVDEEHEDVFYPRTSVNSLSAQHQDAKLKFNLNPDLTSEQNEIAQNLLLEFKDVFVSDVSELTKCNYPDIRFHYDKNKIVNQRNYRMSVDEKQFAEEYIQKLLASDLVEFCTSVYCTPILVVPKQSHTPSNPSYRLVQDFRKVNKILTDLKYPIPDQQDLIDSFQGKFWHSVTDNCSGYTQLSIHPKCRDVTAFDSPSGSRYRWKTLPQGLSIAPALYALAMDHLLMSMKKQKKVVNYFDDTHIGTESFDQHVETLREYFQLLRENNIQLNVKKSTFFQKRVQFLGFDVDGKTVAIPERRVKAIKGMVEPKNKDELRTTLGVYGYNRRFIQNYSQKALPLLKLLKNDVEFKWEEEQQNSFDLLKSSLSSPLSLRLFDPKANNRITVDASYKGLGAALYQQDKQTKRFHPVGFASRKLKASETKLPIYYLECSALVFAFVNFRCYLQNRNVNTEVFTDHQSLQSLLRTPKPEGILAKHILYLSQFSFTIRYRPGKANIDADSLSRSPVEEAECSVDDLVEEVFPDRFQGESKLNSVTTRGQAARDQSAEEEAELLDERNKSNENSDLMTFVLNKSSILRDLQNSDPELAEIGEQVKSETLGTKDKHYKLKDGLLHWEYNSKLLLVVPRSCRKYVLSEFHDNRGHRRAKHLLQNILTLFWWRTMHKDISAYVKSCHFCMTTENSRAKPGLLKPTPPAKMFSQISCDFVGEFKASKNKNKHFCVIVDAYTKFMWTKPVRKADSQNAIECLENFTLQFGLCDSYTTDGASYFTSFAFQEMLNKWDVVHNAFRQVPHCNGQVERSIQSLKNILMEFLLQFEENWETYLQFATFLYNINYHDSIHCSPFYAVHGFHPVVPGIVQLLPASDEKLEVKLQKHTKFLKDLKDKIEASQAKHKEYYDKGRQEVTYSIGQLVRVKNESDDISWPNKKIKWIGPYKIVGKKSGLFYYVMVKEKDSHGNEREVVKEYHVVNIRPYHTRPDDLMLQSIVVQRSKVDLDEDDKFHIRHVNDNVLNAPLDHVIAHCISADLKMNAGFAKEIQYFFRMRDWLSVADVEICKGKAVRIHSLGRDFYNLVTKQFYFEKPTYETLAATLLSLKNQMIANSQTELSIPKIACGLDGRDLSRVLKIIQEVFRKSGIHVTMYHYQPSAKNSMITDFTGEYEFLSLDEKRSFCVDGFWFPTVEHAYQAGKATKEHDIYRIMLAKHPEAEARKIGENIGGEKLYQKRMELCIASKFSTNPDLAKKLENTGNRFLIYENKCCDRFYGTCVCDKHIKRPGSNRLGLILMALRSNLQSGGACAFIVPQRFLA